jgi:hypothetical protein
MEVTNYTSLLFVKAATIAEAISGWTPNWSEYPTDNNHNLVEE